jgi:hypothetical protein
VVTGHQNLTDGAVISYSRFASVLHNVFPIMLSCLVHLLTKVSILKNAATEYVVARIVK